MNTDDLICVGVTDEIVLSSTIGRNKNRIPGAVISEIIKGTEEFAGKMASYGINIRLTGGETADVGDLVQTVIVDSTVCARIKRSDVIDNAKIVPGDVIIGLSSYGKAVYEEEYNGGTGSNGLTSARHDLFSSEVGAKYPETYDQNIPSEVVYTGSKQLAETEPETGVTYGKLLLSPTRTYAPVIREMLAAFRPHIHGMVHCSGGGQTKVLHFIDKLRIVKDNMFPVPPLFRVIQEESGTPWKEMYTVFNMGHRMEIYANESVAGKLMEISRKYGIDAQIIGRVYESAESEVLIKSQYGEFSYGK